MFGLPSSDSNLLQTVLKPLLEDFQYWFEQADRFLATDQLSVSVLPRAAQQSLLTRIRSAQREVQAAQSLLAATDGQAGIEVTVLMEWHQLVTQCWQLQRQQRQRHPGSDSR